jgi:hypothetical protein
MKSRYDPWYLRLPDGRVVKAKSTSSVRHHVEAGNIPLNSMARRESHEEWVSLAWIAEFADLGGGTRRPTTPATEDPEPLQSSGNGSAIELKTGISARLDPMRLQTVGIRGLVDELISAFDSAIGVGKGTFACAVLAFAAFGLGLLLQATLAYYPEAVWLAQLTAVLVGGLVMAVIVAILTRQTHLELSTMRPVRFAEARKGCGPLVFRVFLGYAATIGACFGVMVLLQHLIDWSATAGGLSGQVAEVVQASIWGASAVIGFVLGIFVLLSFLVPPILIVEECSVGDALREWRALLREHRIRALVYEGLALALALVAALPLAVPVFLTLQFLPVATHNWLCRVILHVLGAIVAGPALTFLAVANLFIYLNLRYEYSPSK